jgi:hypothetical protein
MTPIVAPAPDRGAGPVPVSSEPGPVVTSVLLSTAFACAA